MSISGGKGAVDYPQVINIENRNINKGLEIKTGVKAKAVLCGKAIAMSTSGNIKSITIKIGEKRHS